MKIKEVKTDSKNSTDLSIIVIYYNMQREILRTIHSLLSPYQLGVENKNIEIIVIDNGSEHEPDFGEYKDKIKYVKYNPINKSPVDAINYGINIASSDLVGVLIDGARMSSPGLCKNVLSASYENERAIITTIACHIGPIVQMQSVFKGYDKNLEDDLLDAIDWKNNGYHLFLISCLAGSSKNGLLGQNAESNAIFMSKELWAETGGYDPLFVTAGGGFVNLDLKKRLGNFENAHFIRLTNEATFHQVHGGIATNQKKGANGNTFRDEYINIRGEMFRPSKKIEALYGEINSMAKYFYFRDSENDVNFDKYNAIRTKLNCLLKSKTDGLQFQ